MGKIRILTDETASQVAAGEVVERPASIVKELAENCLDAGASRIVVEFSGGGARSISVLDDGCGMDSEDAVLCLERHATSKIRTAADLHTVRSMGFRGEALPSIASVSRFRLVTREHSSPVGTEVLVSGGRLESVKEAGAPPGTRIDVRDLFFNLPARKKFLRGEETESAQILQVMQALALSAPAVAVELRREGRQIFSVPAAPGLEVRIADLFGRAFLERLVPAGHLPGEGLELTGFFAKPGQGRRDRLQQWVILNGRPVACPEIAQPLREAYAGALPSGQHPLAVLVLDMDPTLVDCNVHPAKRLVRFSKPEAVRRLIFDAARQALHSLKPAPPATRTDLVPPSVSTIFRRPEPELPAKPAELQKGPRPEPRAHDQSSSDFSSPAPVTGPSPEPALPCPAIPYRMLGKAGDFFFVLEGPEGLVIMDSRPARERVVFESLLKQMESGSAASQRLLIPEVLELPAREHAWIAENTEALKEAGFLLEPFGGLTVKVEGVPALAGGRDAGRLLHEIAATLRSAGRLPRGHGLRETVARAVCRSAMSSGGSLSLIEGGHLLQSLLACELPYAGPFGQPTLIQFSFAELDRKFGR